MEERTLDLVRTLTFCTSSERYPKSSSKCRTSLCFRVRRVQFRIYLISSRAAAPPNAPTSALLFGEINSPCAVFIFCAGARTHTHPAGRARYRDLRMKSNRRTRLITRKIHFSGETSQLVRYRRPDPRCSGHRRIPDGGILQGGPRGTLIIIIRIDVCVSLVCFFNPRPPLGAELE